MRFRMQNPNRLYVLLKHTYPDTISNATSQPSSHAMIHYFNNHITKRYVSHSSPHSIIHLQSQSQSKLQSQNQSSLQTSTEASGNSQVHNTVINNFHTFSESLLVPFDHKSLEMSLDKETRSILRNKTYSGRHAAVLLPLFVSSNDHVPYILFTQRADSLRSHSSQVSFPGGKMDEDDESLEATALRESQEEIGLDPSNVKIIGTIDQFLSRNRLLVTPVVGIIESDFEPKLNADECSYIFKVPLTFFLQKELYKDSKRKNLIMDGVTYKTRHWIKADNSNNFKHDTKNIQYQLNDNSLQDSMDSKKENVKRNNSIFTMEQDHEVEFRIWGFSLGVLIQFFKRGWSVSSEVWGDTFDETAFNLWLKTSLEVQ